MTRMLAEILIAWAMRREPDFIIGGAADPYIVRWYVTPWRRKNSRVHRWLQLHLPAIYLHRIIRSDDDRALHDHPWLNASLVLRGSYLEHTINAGGVGIRKRRRAGDFVIRRAKAAHRLEIDQGDCWSLFFVGFRVRDWGFHCPRGWVHWRDFTNPDDDGATIGRGCGERGE